MIDTRENTPLYDLILKAIEMEASGLEIEFKDGYEEIVAMSDNIGFGIGRLKSDSKEATDLREEMYDIAKRKKKIIIIADKKYAVRVKISDSFGEDEFHVTFTDS